jgi:hypothetical protein
VRDVISDAIGDAVVFGRLAFQKPVEESWARELRPLLVWPLELYRPEVEAVLRVPARTVGSGGANGASIRVERHVFAPAYSLSDALTLTVVRGWIDAFLGWHREVASNPQEIGRAGYHSYFPFWQMSALMAGSWEAFMAAEAAWRPFGGWERGDLSKDCDVWRLAVFFQAVEAIGPAPPGRIWGIPEALDVEAYWDA